MVFVTWEWQIHCLFVRNVANWFMGQIDAELCPCRGNERKTEINLFIARKPKSTNSDDIHGGVRRTTIII